MIELCYVYDNVANINNNTFKSFIRDTDRILENKNTWSSFLTKNKTNVPIKLKHCKNQNHDHVGLDMNGDVIYSKPHMVLSLVPNDYIVNTACPSVGAEGDDAGVKLSCTRYGYDNPKDIYINIYNWEQGFVCGLKRDGFVKNNEAFDYVKFTQRYPEFTGGNVAIHNKMCEKYKEYVINHEVGHALGRGHYTPRNTDNPQKNKGFPAPIMMQQTKGLYGYEFNTYPLKEEDFNYDEDFPEYLLKHFVIGL